jgi:predicted NAD/FAD-binding protein
MRIAVVGGGISGMLAARLLADEHDVHLFEANGYVGGHTHTVDLEVHGERYAADTGFMVFNDRTYPNLVRMLDLLGVASRASDMSFSVRCDRTGLEYQGGTLLGLFAQRRNLFRPSFYRMLRDILRFNREAPALLDSEDETTTLDDYLRDRRYSTQFVEHYLVPMGASIWSTPPGMFRQFPARYTVGFFRNHGLLQLGDRPQWKTIVGGAVRYVEALLRPLADRVRLDCPVERVQRQQEHVMVTPRGGEAEVFDCAVLAAHADQSLAMLADPSPAEREILGAIPYQANKIVLHTDTRLLPRTQRAWASWNYHMSGSEQPTVTLTYNLNLLQGHRPAEPILETLNPITEVDATKVLDRMTYHHPVYSVRAIDAQRRYHEINGQRRTYYCGAYWGYGFHEDGVRSALAVAECLGCREHFLGSDRGSNAHEITSP